MLGGEVGSVVAVSSADQPCEIDDATKAAKAVSSATSRFTFLSGLVSGRMGAAIGAVWDMQMNQRKGERFRFRETT